MPDWLYAVLLFGGLYVLGSALNIAEDRVKRRQPVIPRRRRRDYHYS